MKINKYLLSFATLIGTTIGAGVFAIPYVFDLALIKILNYSIFSTR